MRQAQKARREFPYWLLAAGVIAVLFAWFIAVDGDYHQIFLNLSRGIWTTLIVAFVSFFCASVLGLGIALARTSERRFFREFASFYTEVMRGLPILVVLFYIAFVGAPQLVALYNLVFSWAIELGWLDKIRVRDFSMSARAILALTLCYSAFIAEIFRSGIESIPRGQVEGAMALGLSKWQTFRLVVWPQALKNVLPPLGNDFIAMIKDSALVSVLGVQDITQLGKIYSASTFLFFETYNVVAYLYLTMTMSLSLCVRGLERHLKRNSHDTAA